VSAVSAVLGESVVSVASVVSAALVASVVSVALVEWVVRAVSVVPGGPEEWEALAHPRCLPAGSAMVPVAPGDTIRSIVAVPLIATGLLRIGLGAVRAAILLPNAKPALDSESPGRAGVWPAVVE
jgi:hypothetical protein